MRILRIADVSDARTGGMSRVMLCPGDHMRAMGHEVDYLLQNDLQVPGPRKLRNRITLPLAIPHIVRQRIRHLQQYDVVDIHEPAAAGYCFLRRLWKELPPVVVSSQGVERRHQLAELSYREQHSLPRSVFLRHFRVTVFQSIFAIRNCDHVICSNSQDTKFLQSIGIPETKISQVNNGVDEEFLTAGMSGKRTGAGVGVLFMGTWILRKGIRELVFAMSKIMERHPQVSLTIAGCALPKEAILQEFLPGFHHRITVIRHLSEKPDLVELYRRHAILVLPSFFEGQPLVMLEAAAMGLAIITTSVCGMVDFISDGRNGLLVPVGDGRALARSLEKLMLDSELVRKLGESGRRSVQSYTWRHSAETILSAYEQAIQTKEEGKRRL